MEVIEDLAPPPKIEVRPRAVSRRERWQLRLPLLPALIYTIVVTQVPFLVTLWYSFQNYFWNQPGGATWAGVSNYKEVFTDPNFRAALVRSVTMTAIAVAPSTLASRATTRTIQPSPDGAGIFSVTSPNAAWGH